MPMDLKEKNHKQKHNVWKNRQFRKSFGHAWDGVKTIWQDERNMRNHVAFGMLPVLAGFVFGVSNIELCSYYVCF